MIKEIKKPSSKQTVTAILSGDFSKVDKIEETAKEDAKQVFNSVSSGAVPLIWYDLPPVRCQSGAVSFMRYALHRSTKKEGCLQLSCMELIGSEIIPTSDIQFKINDDYDRREFFRSLPGVTKMTFK